MKPQAPTSPSFSNNLFAASRPCLCRGSFATVSVVSHLNRPRDVVPFQPAFLCLPPSPPRTLYQRSSAAHSDWLFVIFYVYLVSSENRICCILSVAVRCRIAREACEFLPTRSILDVICNKMKECAQSAPILAPSTPTHTYTRLCIQSTGRNDASLVDEIPFWTKNAGCWHDVRCNER